MNRILLAIAAVASFGASGCIVTTSSGADTYDECSFDSDCDRFDDFCQSFASGTVATGICTTTCRDSLDCPVTASGFEPLCASISGSSFLCFETCEDSSDCASGFDCEFLESTSFTICVPR